MSANHVYRWTPRLMLLSVLCCVNIYVPAFALDDGEMRRVGPTAQPGQPEILFVNGINTDGDAALRNAQRLSDKLGLGVTLVYNDCTVPAGVDFFAVVSSKLGDFDTELNKAANNVLGELKTRLREDKDVVLIGHSLGGAIIQNVLNAVADQSTDEPELRGRMGHISVLLLGAAVFEDDHALTDGWPRGLMGLFSVSDARDPVAQWWGDVEHNSFYGDSDLKYHAFDAYLRHVDSKRLHQRGRQIIRGEETLVETVAASAVSTECAVRIRVEPMQGQESRRSFNFTLPAWTRLQWKVEGTQRPDAVRFMPMIEDASFLSDGPAYKAMEGQKLRDGTVTANHRPDYIGRVDGLDGGPFYVVIRPVD
jgi:pimeloyl-ACP methyl ester carboxylesterase